MTNEELLIKVKEAREAGKKIGLVQGSWDLFHIGHLRYILKAKELCDFLVIGMDGDAKIRHRKGHSRPIIPEEERYQFIELLNIASAIIIKELDEPKWGLIKSVKPDVLIAIKDNYSDEDIVKLEQICGKVAILPRQSESSTSDKFRNLTLANRRERIKGIDSKISAAIEQTKLRIGITGETPEPLSLLLDYLKESTDWICPVSVGCFWNGKWYFGANQTDLDLPSYDIENRTELYYATVEHAEMNLLKKLGDVEALNVPIWTTLFPCDKCMKVFNNKGVKEIYYLEDHPERNWSKRSHELAEKYGIKTVCIAKSLEATPETEILEAPLEQTYKYTDPRNVREESQLGIMLRMEEQDKDPLDPNNIEQEIILFSDYWYVTLNRFPYDEIEHQFLIASRQPVYNIEDMSEEMWIDLKRLWIKTKVDYKIPGGALCIRFGDSTYSGASLFRLHCHIIEPKSDKKARFTIGGNKTYKKVYLPGCNPQIDKN